MTTMILEFKITPSPNCILDIGYFKDTNYCKNVSLNMLVNLLIRKNIVLPTAYI